MGMGGGLSDAKPSSEGIDEMDDRVSLLGLLVVEFVFMVDVREEIGEGAIEGSSIVERGFS